MLTRILIKPEAALIERFSKFIVEKLGLYFPPKKYDELAKKMGLIFNAYDFDDIDSCFQWIMNYPFNSDKMDVLAQYLTIGETYFFRDTDFFNMLENYLFPLFIKKHQSDHKIKIWSAGCSSGEELYSIAILLSRLIPDINKWNIHLIGTDINQAMLHKAEKGTYQKWSFRSTRDYIKKTYFNKKESSYTIIPQIKKMTKFSTLNLVEDTYPDPTLGIFDLDLIICHNVLMYFSTDQIKKVVHKLTESLSENGWLSVTPIEVPFIEEPNLYAQKLPNIIFSKSKKKNIIKREEKIHSSLPLSKPPKIKESPKPKVQKSEPIKKTVSRKSYDDYLNLYNNKKYDEIIEILEPQIKENIHSQLREAKLLIQTYANKGKIEKAITFCEEILQQEKLNPELHFLHATLLEAKGQLKEAVRSLKRTLFIDPHFIMAYYILGEIDNKNNDLKSAKKNFELAWKLLETHSESEIIPGTEDLNAAYLKGILQKYMQQEVIKNGKK